MNILDIIFNHRCYFCDNKLTKDSFHNKIYCCTFCKTDIYYYIDNKIAYDTYKGMVLDTDINKIVIYNYVKFDDSYYNLCIDYSYSGPDSYFVSIYRISYYIYYRRAPPPFLKKHVPNDYISTYLSKENILNEIKKYLLLQ